MIFDTAEMELLKLAGWFKGLPSDLSRRFCSQIFSPAGIRSLEILRLIYHSEERGQYRLTPTGWDFLSQSGFDYPQDAKYISDPIKLRRREQAARVMFTFYRSGADIFCDALGDLQRPDVFLSNEAMQRSLRRQNTKVWNGLRMCGVGRLGDCGCLLHFADDLGMYFVNEMSRFQKAVAHCPASVSVYAADSYSDAVYWLLHEPAAMEKKHKSDWTSYHSAAKATRIPLHLLECSDVGALQLLIMRQPDYRTKIARRLLADAYRPPHPGLPDTDATIFLEGKEAPVVIAMDMDVKRIGRACRGAIALGLQPQLFAFAEQFDALSTLLAPLGRIGVYQVAAGEIARMLDLSLYDPPVTPFLSEKGEYLYVSQIPKRKKSGRPPVEKMDQGD